MGRCIPCGVSLENLRGGVLWAVGSMDLEKHWENAGEPEILKMEHQRGSYGMGGAREHNPGDTVLEGGARAREDREGWGQGPERWQVLHGRHI